MLPWSLKVLYGLISDNVIIFGSRKRSFIILGSLLQFASLQILFWIPFTRPGPIAYLAMFVNLSQAFMDLIVDSIMVVQQRRDLKNGSELLRSYASFFQMSGLLTGSSLGGWMNQHYHPKWCFLVYSPFGLVVAIAGCCLSSEIDRDGIEEMKGFWTDLQRTLAEMCKIPQIPVLYKVLGLIICSGFLDPSFGEFGFYFITNVRGISKTQTGLMATGGSIAGLIGVFLYGLLLRKYEYRTLYCW